MDLASSFDGIDSSGKPILSGERTTISDPDEQARVEQFLNGGGFAMGTSRKAMDVIDPSRGRVVPMVFRTDGEWVWPKSLCYYLTTHGVPIETKFLNHIRSREYTPAIPDEEQMSMALRLLDEAGRS